MNIITIAFLFMLLVGIICLPEFTVAQKASDSGLKIATLQLQ